MGPVTGAKMADNREEISELVEKRGICRRLAPLARRDRAAPRTPRAAAARRAPRDRPPSPRHAADARTIAARTSTRGAPSTARVPRTVRWDDRAHAVPGPVAVRPAAPRRRLSPSPGRRSPAPSGPCQGSGARLTARDPSRSGGRLRVTLDGNSAGPITH